MQTPKMSEQTPQGLMNELTDTLRGPCGSNKALALAHKASREVDAMAADVALYKDLAGDQDFKAMALTCRERTTALIWRNVLLMWITSWVGLAVCILG
jgi:hypothetical protein